MNREIKFRAWDGEKLIYPVNGWFEKVSLPDHLSYQSMQLGTAIRYLKVMQSTGLKDKNGTEIYEGDIIQTQRQDWGVIIWNAPFFEVTVSETQSSMYSREWFYTVEVIGNIYNNPELIK